VLQGEGFAVGVTDPKQRYHRMDGAEEFRHIRRGRFKGCSDNLGPVLVTLFGQHLGYAFDLVEIAEHFTASCPAVRQILGDGRTCGDSGEKRAACASPHPVQVS
jgi:hypothetical protein